MDINRSHASGAPTEPQSPNDEPRSPASAPQSNVAAAARERDGTLESLAGRRRSRSPDTEDTSGPAGPSNAGERPRKQLRTAQGVRFAEPSGEGSSSASTSSPSQPMARMRAMPRHEADDPEQRGINERIAANQRVLIDRLQVERQPAAEVLQRDWFLAEAGQHLTPSEQHTLLNDVLHLSEEARAEFARMLPAGQGGAYLSRDEGALAHSLGGGAPDVIVRRASWLMRAGLAGRHIPGAEPSALMSRTIEQAEAELRAHFEHGGPGSQAEAVFNVVGSVLFVRTLEDAHRLAQLVLQPRYIRALPDSQRATALWLLTNSLLSANSFAWMNLGSTAASPGAGDEAVLAVNDEVARMQAFTALHRNGLAGTIPLLLEAARSTSSISSHAAQATLFAVAQMVGRGMPDVPAQRALLDLYDLMLPHAHGPDRGQVYTDLASMISALGEPGLQRRAFNLATQHRPGTSRANDWLAHLDSAARTRVLLTLLFQLSMLGDELRDDAFGLLADQTAPGMVERFSGDERRRLLEQARELAAPPGDNLRLLAIVGRLLEHAPVDDIVESLAVLFGHADTAADDDALETEVRRMWDRFLPQLPPDRSGRLLAHAVAVDGAYLSFALRGFVNVDANRLYAMLGGMNDHASEPLANELYEQGMDEPDALHAIAQVVLAERPPAERPAAASSIVQVLCWAAMAQPESQRPQAIGNTARAAIRIIDDAPAEERAAILAAYLRPAPTGSVGVVAFRYLAAAMSAGSAPFHRWLDTVSVRHRLSMATGVARLLPTIQRQDAAARAVTMLEGLYPRSLESWNDHHTLVQALANTLARWPATFEVERTRIGAMIEHGIRALPAGAEHEDVLRRLAAIARQLPQGASSSTEAPLGTHAWVVHLIQSELTRTDDATRERVIGALRGNSGE